MDNTPPSIFSGKSLWAKNRGKITCPRRGNPKEQIQYSKHSKSLKSRRVQLLAENGIFSLPPCPDWFWGPLNLTNIVFRVCLSRNKEGGD
jgi:hypothetical protein